MAVGLKVTTVGVGVEAALKINDYFSVRGGPNWIGFGWITGQDKEKGFQFFVDAGVKFGGHPDVNLTATGGTLSGLPILTNELAKEQGNIANDLKILGFYPLIQIGVNYRF